MRVVTSKQWFVVMKEGPPDLFFEAGDQAATQREQREQNPAGDTLPEEVQINFQRWKFEQF